MDDEYCDCNVPLEDGVCPKCDAEYASYECDWCGDWFWNEEDVPLGRCAGCDMEYEVKTQ